MLLAWLAYRLDWSPGDSANYGELIEPRMLPAATLAGIDGRPLSLAGLRGKWLLLQFDQAACDAWCERKLYFMRQVRRAQGREMGRIERIWVLTDAGTPRKELLAAIDGSHVVRAPEAGFREAFPAPHSAVDHIYLVDPLGNLMLRYPREPDPSRIIKDLKRLLRYTQAG